MMIMNLFLFIAKILYSPLFPSCPWLNLHQTVLFSDTGKGAHGTCSLCSTNSEGDLRSPDEFGQRAEGLPTTNSEGDLRSPDEFDMLLMDYVPNLSVTKQVIWDLCIGKTVPGKIRIFHLTNSILVKGNYHENIMERVQQKIDHEDYYDGSEPIILPILCKYGVDQVIQSQDHKYHLYNNNCWHFSKKCITTKLFR